MSAEPETCILRTWQESLVPELLSRLLRPLSRPGVVSLAISRRILGWLSYLDGRLALATEIARRRGQGAGLLSKPVPIVHARWMLRVESPAMTGEARGPREAAKELPIVRAEALSPTVAGPLSLQVVRATAPSLPEPTPSLVTAAPGQTAVIHAAMPPGPAPFTSPSQTIVTPAAPPRSLPSPELTSKFIMPPARRRPAAVQGSVIAPTPVPEVTSFAFTKTSSVSSPTTNEQKRHEQVAPRPVVTGRPMPLGSREFSSDPRPLLARREAPLARREARPIVTPAMSSPPANMLVPRPALPPGVPAVTALLPRAIARSPVPPSGSPPTGDAIFTPASTLLPRTGAAPVHRGPSPDSVLPQGTRIRAKEAAPAIMAAGRADVDLDALTDKVQRKLLRQLAAERERKGSLR